MADDHLIKNSDIGDPDLLASDEPGPFQILNPVSNLPILLVCDHASCRIPKSLGNMGLDPFARRCHLAIDIGAGPLTKKISTSLGVTAVMARYSRLVVDCNRHLMDPGAFLEFGDGIVVGGNRNLSAAEKERRAGAIYRPYHTAIDEQVNRLRNAGPQPAFIAVHSFTPVLNGKARRWQVGVLWDTDTVLRDIFLEGFSSNGYIVGDNEPYSGKAPQDFTIDTHAEGKGLPHVGIEVRQDLIDHASGIDKIANVMHEIIASLPERLEAVRQCNTA